MNEMTENNELRNKVAHMGLPMFEVEDKEDANAVLADVVKSRRLRYWEGFPVLLANSEENKSFDLEEALVRLDAKDRKPFFELLAMSLALYKTNRLKFAWAERLKNNFNNEEKDKYLDYLLKFKNNENYKLAGYDMSSERVKTMFTNYFTQSQKKLYDYASAKDSFGLEYAMSQVFSPKQKELFLRKFKREKMTKTEREYFYRTVKKKALALANSDLQRMAKQVLSK
jgi:hypothetical protein